MDDPAVHAAPFKREEEYMSALTPMPIAQPLSPIAAVPVAVALPSVASVPVAPVVSVAAAMPLVATAPTGLAAFRFAAWSVARNVFLRATGRYVPNLEALEASGASAVARDALANASAEVSRAAALMSAAVPTRSVVAAPTASAVRYLPSAELMQREAALTAQNGGVRVFITTPIERDLDPRLDFEDGVVAVVWRGVGEHRIVERRMSASGTPATLMLPDDTKFVHLLPIKVRRDGRQVAGVMTTY